MDHTMSPSNPKLLTSGQIGKFEEIFGDGLRRAGLPSDLCEIVLEQKAKGLVTELVSVVYRYLVLVGDMSEGIMITRQIEMDTLRSLTPEQMLRCSPWFVQHLDRKVVRHIPQDVVKEQKLVFFSLPRWMNGECWRNPAIVKAEYARRGLVPALPYVTMQANINEKNFAYEHPNCTFWQDAEGRYCFLAYFWWGGEYRVIIDHRGGMGRDINWVFAGTPVSVGS